MKDIAHMKDALLPILIPLALATVREVFREEVRTLVGERYKRGQRTRGFVRWGEQHSSIYLFDRKVRLAIPRVRDRRDNKEIPLQAYARLWEPRPLGGEDARQVLLALSRKEYLACAESIPAMIGFSTSAVSSGFMRSGARRLQALMERRLDTCVFNRIEWDGRTFADDDLVVPLGFTGLEKPVLLGLLRADEHDENALAEGLRQLAARGLKDGFRCVIKGGDGLHAALGRIFGEGAMVPSETAA